MISKIKCFKIVVLLIVVAVTVNSCEKDQPKCRGNCVSISINGNAYLKTNGAALPNIPVEAKWFIKSYCIGCTSYKVASGVTGNDGKFNFNTIIDTTFFKDYFLSVRVPTDTNYISLPGTGNARYMEERFYDFQLNETQNLKFEFYPKTFLTIHLNRTLSDNFNSFSVNHNFTPVFDYYDFQIAGPQFATDTIIKMETSADIYTRIVWKKTLTSGQSIVQTDSLVCTKAGANIFDIYY